MYSVKSDAKTVLQWNSDPFSDVKTASGSETLVPRRPSIWVVGAGEEENEDEEAKATRLAKLAELEALEAVAANANPPNHAREDVPGSRTVPPVPTANTRRAAAPPRCRCALVLMFRRWGRCMGLLPAPPPSACPL